MFRTQYDKHQRVIQPSGSRVRQHYQSRLDAKGNLVLIPDGYLDDYAEIQSHADSVDIHKILDRFAAGEKDVLSKMQGFYADFADVPSTYQEVLNAVIAGEETFNSLPVEIKDKFGHSFQRWMMAMGQPDFYDAMGLTHADLTAQTSKGVPDSSTLAPDPVLSIAQREVTT